MASEILYECRNLSFDYLLGTTRVTALDQINVKIPSRKLVAVAGPSGSGKSTLLFLLGLIEPTQKGELLFQNREVSQLSENEKTAVRRSQLGFVFQNFLLFESLSVEENVGYFLKNLPMTRKARRERSRAALAEVGLENHAAKNPMQLSGGQRQRVAIARALAKDPAVIIADEPTASLDQNTGRQIIEIFDRLAQKNGVSVLFSSHDPMALSFAHHTVQISDGRATMQEGARS